MLSEVRRVCDRVGILRAGQLVGLEDVDTLLDRGGKRVHLRVADDVPEELTALDGVFNVDAVDEEFHFTYAGDYNSLIRRLGRYDILDIDISEPPLEDVFMHFYGEGDATTSDRDDIDV